jgi:hypothetical protein
VCCQCDKVNSAECTVSDEVDCTECTVGVMRWTVQGVLSV